jgi:hypothetical protein
MIPCIGEAASPFLKLPLAYFSGFGSIAEARYERTKYPASHMPNLKCTCPRSQTAVFPKIVPVLISYTRMERSPHESKAIRW